MSTTSRFTLALALAAATVVAHPTIATAGGSTGGQCISLSAQRPYSSVAEVATTDGTRWSLPLTVDAWSPNRKQIVFIGENKAGLPDRALHIAKPTATRSSVLFDFGTRNRQLSAVSPQWSPDGKRVAVFVNTPGAALVRNEVWVVTVAARTAVRVSAPTQRVSNTMAWTPDSARLVYGVSNDATGYIADADAVDVWITNASGSGGRSLLIDTAYYLTSSYPIGTTFNPPARIGHLSVSPDGTTLAFNGFDFQGINVYSADLWTADIDGSDVTRIADNSTGSTSSLNPRWSPDGTRLAVGLSGSETALGMNGLGIFDVSGNRFTRISRTGSSTGVPAWSSDGRFVAFSADRSTTDFRNDVRVLEVATGARPRVFAGTSNVIREDVVTWVPCLVAAPLCSGRPATILGTNGKDTITGTSKNDVIVAFGGSDTVTGAAGQDRLCGGGGDDTLNGGPGDDRLDGEAGSDTCRAGGGRDVFLRCE